MNKNEIKQIILEEIQAAINEQTEDERIAQAMEAGDEDELENLAAGALGRAEQEVVDTLTKDYEGDIDDEDIAAISKDWNDEQDDMFGKPNFVEEEGLDLSEAKEALVYKLKSNHTYDEVLRFMQRVNVLLKTYKSPRQKRPKKRFSAEDMKKVAAAITSSTGFTSKDIRLAVDAYNSPAQANKFIKALEMKGYIELITQLKKSMVPDRDPNAPETRGRKAKSAEFDVSDDPMADLDALGLGGDIDLSDPLAENNNTMSELEKYIKKVIKEAKNPLAAKMKEVEIQGRTAALETKLAAVAEMIEETEGRLTRIDEDNEFRDMMDKGAVKEVRKQLKELERAQAKLQKEYDKVSGGRKRETVVDELDADSARDKADNLDALADKQDALDKEAEDSMEEVSKDFNEEYALSELTAFIQEDDKDAEERFKKEMEKINPSARKQFHSALAAMPADGDIDDIMAFMMGAREGKSYELNESTLRMQKLAGLITESELKKKLSLNEEDAGAFRDASEINKKFLNMLSDRAADYVERYDIFPVYSNVEIDVESSTRADLPNLKEPEDIAQAKAEIAAIEEVKAVMAKMGSNKVDLGGGYGLRIKDGLLHTFTTAEGGEDDFTG